MKERNNYRVPAAIAKQMSCEECHFFDQTHEMCTFHESDNSWISRLSKDSACFDFQPINFDYSEVDKLIADAHTFDNFL